MESFSSQTSSFNETHHSQEFELFKSQLNKVQILVDELSGKIIDKTLCVNDITIMLKEMQLLSNLELESKPLQMLSTFVSFKLKSLKTLQESYRICNWLMEKQCNKMDNIFDINSYIDKIIDACTDKEDSLDSMDTLFKDCFMNTNNLCLSFYGNISETISNPIVSSQMKREYKRSQKRQLEELVVPDEVDNDEGDNELQVTLMKVNSCLKRALLKNKGKPISFFKFAIDPFSLTYTVENFFHLALLVKDRIVKIEKNQDNEDFELATITVNENNTDDVTQNNKDDIISSLLTINHDLWKFYIEKYKIREQMIDQ